MFTAHVFVSQCAQIGIGALDAIDRALPYFPAEKVVADMRIATAGWPNRDR
jgi:hypothetical protein